MAMPAPTTTLLSTIDKLDDAVRGEVEEALAEKCALHERKLREELCGTKENPYVEGTIVKRHITAVDFEMTILRNRNEVR